MQYGLIGGRLGHSYSKIIHELLCDYTYDLCPLPTEEQAHAFMRAREFKAVNVTIPYKQLVMPYCDEIDEMARAIHAVNTIVNRGGRLYGYNTDYAGFCYLLDRHGVELRGKTVLILGTGGTHHTTRAVARDRGAAAVITVSRRPDRAQGQISYDEAAGVDAQVVINTSPAGMYPEVGVCNLDISRMQHLEAVLDAIYNPFRTELLLRAEERGITACNGFEMLVAQAVYAAEHFLDRPFADCNAEIARVHSQLTEQLSNVALIGMPSSGKSSIGRALARRTGKTLVDLDEEIERMSGRRIPDIFAQVGEAEFRRLETAAVAKFAKENRQILACGGGVVKTPGNVRLLRQNGVVVFIDRPVGRLAVGGYRPLSKSAEALRAMEAERRPLYQAAADVTVANLTTLEAAVDAAAEGIHEIFDPERA